MFAGHIKELGKVEEGACYNAMIPFLPFTKLSYTKLPFTNISYTKLPASTEKNLSFARPVQSRETLCINSVFP